jgi:hypothetical protein
MAGEAHVQLALLHGRRASGDLLRIVGFGAQLLRRNAESEVLYPLVHP